MSHQAFLEYLAALVRPYRIASRPKKTQLLNDAVLLTGKNRKTLIRYLSSDPDQFGKRRNIRGRGRKPEYFADELLPHIRRLWAAMERISGMRMKAALKDWLPHYQHPEFNPRLQRQLEKMSAATLERFLKMLRRENEANRGLSTTSSGLRALKGKVPINTLDRHATRPGFTQADTVAHCGTTTAGQYANSLTLTDLFSAWTENRALPSKKALEVRRCFVDMKQTLPFELLAINTDSGSEFINSPMIEFMNTFYGTKPITFTRSRPYQKNDNAYVEQKNYTHVRQLFGYERIEDPLLVDRMNEIYRDYWNPLHNFFLPSQKLIEKVRVGAKIVKKYDLPQTPYDRLMKSGSLSLKQSQALQERRQQLNPFSLAQGLEMQLKTFFQLLKQSQIPTKREAA